MKAEPVQAGNQPETRGPARDQSASGPMAVIDIGTSAVRMTIAQMDGAGSFDILEFLQQAVSLGKDTFTLGFIERARMEECARALKSFRKIIEEHGISRRDQIRAVATTAVREAENCDAFLDTNVHGDGHTC